MTYDSIYEYNIWIVATYVDVCNDKMRY